MLQPAARERVADRIQGVSTHVLGGGEVLEPILCRKKEVTQRWEKKSGRKYG